MFKVIVFVNNAWHWLSAHKSESSAFRSARKYTMETGHETQVVKYASK